MKVFWWIVAVVLIGLGLATVWLPIPTGVPLIATGLVLVIATSRKAARLLRKRRRKTDSVDAALIWVEQRAPHAMARVLKRTRPRKRGNTPDQVT